MFESYSSKPDDALKTDSTSCHTNSHHVTFILRLARGANPKVIAKLPLGLLQPITAGRRFNGLSFSVGVACRHQLTKAACDGETPRFSAANTWGPGRSGWQSTSVKGVLDLFPGFKGDSSSEFSDMVD